MMADWTEAHFYLTAFMALHTTRQYGAMGGIYPISFDSVMCYADRLVLDREQAWHFWLVLRAMDDSFVRAQNEKAREAAKAGQGNRPRESLPRKTREPR